MSGLAPDARTMIERARVEAQVLSSHSHASQVSLIYSSKSGQNYWFTYNEPMRVESVTNSVCNLAMQFGEGGDAEEGTMSRPFGVALLIGGVDKVGPNSTPTLFQLDPSGTYIRYDAKAIGSGSEGAQAQLQEHYDKVRKSVFLCICANVITCMLLVCFLLTIPKVHVFRAC